MGAISARRSSHGACVSPSHNNEVAAAGHGSAAIEAAVYDSAAIEAAVYDSVSLVCDPEYPEVTIAELGILHNVAFSEDGTTVRIELIPTMLGCPALDVIARDVVAAARAACEDVEADAVPEAVFVDDPVWTPERISPSAVGFLAREYTVAVRSRSNAPSCPHCGNPTLEHRSDFGPTPCRSVYWCSQCRNPIEVVGRPVEVGLQSSPA